MSPRTPARPPALAGFKYVEVLGSGGFADVYRYTQLGLGRDVAVKVLLHGLGRDAQAQLQAEAELMAMLSNHPSIVSIYQAGLADDGRPYLVMEVCRPGHLGARMRRQPLSVPRALEIGIQVAGAVETAHRLGVLHRDIKPANILFTEFNRPALTDFGISTSARTGEGTTAFSVAWAPPEQLEGRPTGPSADVYSLAATIWASLRGRSPFEVPGGRNDSLSLAERVRTAPVPPIGRSDVPASLERVLATAMAKQSGARFATALDFARALQSVQAELHLPLTTVDIQDRAFDEDYTVTEDSGTRVTGFIAVDPQPRTGTDSHWTDVSGSTRATTLGSDMADPTPVAPRTPSLAPGAPPPDDLTRPTILRGGAARPEALAQAPARQHAAPSPSTPTAATPAPHPAAARTPRTDPAVLDAAPRPHRAWGRWALGIGAAAIVVALAAAAVVLSGGLPGRTPPPAPPTIRPMDPVGATVPKPVFAAATVQDGQVTFTWRNPDPKPGDSFLYSPEVPGSAQVVREATEATASVTKQPGRTCILVTTKRADGRASDAAEFCDA